MEGMTDAALTILETGDQKAVDTIRRIPYYNAPNAHDRLLRLVEHGHARLEKFGVLSGVFHKMLRSWRSDARIRQALADNLARYPLDGDLAETAASFP
jgi:hypothetical protein